MEDFKEFKELHVDFDETLYPSYIVFIRKKDKLIVSKEIIKNHNSGNLIKTSYYKSIDPNLDAIKMYIWENQK
jgi:hypothetical protein